MPLVTHPIVLEGPMVDMQVGWSGSWIKILRAAHRPIPQPLDIRAIIDTGAQVTTLDRSVIRALQLPLASFTAANLPAGSGLSFTTDHDAGLTILAPTGSGQANLIVSDLVVADLDLGPVGYQALIGRDVLARCRFLYDGPHGQFTLEY